MRRKQYTMLGSPGADPNNYDMPATRIEQIAMADTASFYPSIKSNAALYFSSNASNL